MRATGATAGAHVDGGLEGAGLLLLDDAPEGGGEEGEDGEGERDEDGEGHDGDARGLPLLQAEAEADGHDPDEG